MLPRQILHISIQSLLHDKSPEICWLYAQSTLGTECSHKQKPDQSRKDHFQIRTVRLVVSQHAYESGPILSYSACADPGGGGIRVAIRFLGNSGMNSVGPSSARPRNAISVADRW